MQESIAQTFTYPGTKLKKIILPIYYLCEICSILSETCILYQLFTRTDEYKEINEFTCNFYLNN